MKINKIRLSLWAICLLLMVSSTACKTGSTASSNNTSNTDRRNLPPERVDIRGSIINRHYSQGQVMLEVEGIVSQNTRYNRAFVLVLPTSQITDLNGSTISLSELQIGQNVAVLLRAGGKGNLVGMGVARKMWVE
ncbi:hypothetical protein HUW51_17760 [Adhaeribacter swui]|uniref:DUF5666 domain-containing protein n=1 Tax=Adhaeribacter swui TaxID=2086471 RepID=A0A7G7GBE8_9BACT|nr:hypothetical protein [Adhaeribacter swui]QNF34482.1 hypothetical protein HUW51_17760 [Adhaeribacter swui]